MLNNIIIKEIKNFKVYDLNDKLIRHQFSLTSVGLIHNSSLVAKLQGTYHGYASNESIECNTKLYKIKGKAVIQDVDTCGIYEGNFTANHVIFIKDDNSIDELVMLLLKTGDDSMYNIVINEATDKYIDEYDLKCKEFFLSEFNKMVNRIVDTSTYCFSVKEYELIEDISQLLKKYRKWGI